MVLAGKAPHELALVIVGSGFGMHKSKTKTASRRGVASALGREHKAPGPCMETNGEAWVAPVEDGCAS
jgi:hypothetical protein